MTTLSPGKFWGFRRLADADGRFKMLAVDQRPPIKNLICERRGVDVPPYEDVAGFKLMLIQELQALASATLVDPHFAYPHSFGVIDQKNGLILTLEDSVFDDTPAGRQSRQIDDWSVEKIKRCGGDAVKVLAWYRPDADTQICRHQQDFTKRIGEACAQYDIPFLFELLVYPLAGDAERTKDYVEMTGKNADHVLQSVAEFARPDYAIDIFKLESPLEAGVVPGVGGEAWEDAQALFDEMGRLAGRPWVMLSAGAGMAEFRNILSHAYRAGASGYLAGRAIWADAFKAFPDWGSIRGSLRDVAAPYMRDINGLTERQASPWYPHPRFGDEVELPNRDSSFRHHYPGFGG
jgi:tagatose 1,6-diphosphate aldolase